MQKKCRVALMLSMQFCLATVSLAPEQEPTVVIETSQAHKAPMQLFLGVTGYDAQSEDDQIFLESLKKCLEYGKTFQVTSELLAEAPNKKSSVQQLFTKKYDCALFLAMGNKPFKRQQRVREWRLYDTLEGVMLKGKRQVDSDQGAAVSALLMAQVLLNELVGESPAFLSKIAYRKRDSKGKLYSLCQRDIFLDSQPEILFTSQRIIIAPEWSSDGNYIFYSEFMPSKVPLRACDKKGRKQTVLDFDGTTVGVSSAPHTDDVIYCRSGTIWRYCYDETVHKGIHTALICEEQPSACPRLMGNGDILYCTNGKIKRYDAQTEKSTILTPDGYSVAPAYCPKTQKVLYSKRINGFMQLFTCSDQGADHTQLTFESSHKKSLDYRSHKTDPCWSPCGRYAAFCWERDSRSQIALLDTKRGCYEIITPLEEHCSYPAWSPDLGGSI